jgi:RHS repeat-associated protein
MVTNGVGGVALPKTINQYFDPSVEFLELGETDNGVTTWKIYGPDLNGTYGGMNGVGGLEAVVSGTATPSPIVSDIRGNGYAVYNVPRATLTWYSSWPTGFGAVPSYRVLPLGQGVEIAAASAWRGKWSDISGLYWLGARYYDPVTGRFLGADPLGHEADPSLYTFCGGDPINSFDSDGRITSSALAVNQALTGSYADAVFTGIVQGLVDVGFPSASGITKLSSDISGFPIGQVANPFLQNALGYVQDSVQNGIDQHTSSFNTAQGYIYAASGVFSSVAPLLLPGVGEEAAGTELMSEFEATTTSVASLGANAPPVISITETAAEGQGALAGSVRNVNPTGGTMNCVNCAIATDATLAGNAASALPGGPTSISALEDTFGGTFQPVSGQMQIGSVLSQSGNGARGIVFGGSTSGDVGHVFNALNRNGTIQFLDGQIGGSGLNNFNNFQNFQFLLTHPGTP